MLTIVHKWCHAKLSLATLLSKEATNDKLQDNLKGRAGHTLMLTQQIQQRRDL